jgi:hypothetical protein
MVVAFTGEWGFAAWRRPGPARVTHREEGGAVHGPTDAGQLQRAFTVVYGDETDVAGLDVAHAGVPARVGRQPFRSSLIQEGFFSKFLN